MATDAHWRDPEGVSIIKSVVLKKIPQWPDGLRPAQLEAVIRILDGEDLLDIAPTGSGKSALFFVPILVHQELSAHPDLYPNYSKKHRRLPVGIVVTPTKGLARNLVQELALYDVSALSYCHETLTEARKTDINLSKEIFDCQKYQVIFVDPEHLKSKEWRRIANSETFSKVQQGSMHPLCLYLHLVVGSKWLDPSLAILTHTVLRIRHDAKN